MRCMLPTRAIAAANMAPTRSTNTLISARMAIMQPGRVAHVTKTRTLLVGTMKKIAVGAAFWH
jgi:hypothetical protein